MIKLGLLKRNTDIGRAVFDALPELAQWALVAKYGRVDFALGDLRGRS